MMMNNIIEFVKPELLCVSVVLYFVGCMLKQSQTIKDKYIPVLLGVFGVVVCLFWVFGNSNINNYTDLLNALYTSIVQGVMTAGLSTYVNQIIKQYERDE